MLIQVTMLCTAGEENVDMYGYLYHLEVRKG